ncbi:RDD family protein (plasmid) [Rhodococcus opacus]
MSTSRRLSARLIDLVLVSVVSYTASNIASVVLLDSVDWDVYRAFAAVLGIAVALGSIGYFIACDHLVGYTLGKRLLGVQIVQRSGCCPTLRQSFIRNAFLLPMYVGAAAGSVSLLTTAGADSLATTVTGLAAGGAISLLGTITTIGIGVYLLITIHSSPEDRGLHDTKSDTIVTARSPIGTPALTPARN